MISQNALRHAEKCRFCWMCRHICPVAGSTNRERTKEWIRQMDKEHRGFKKRLYGAMERGHVSGF